MQPSRTPFAEANFMKIAKTIFSGLIGVTLAGGVWAVFEKRSIQKLELQLSRLAPLVQEARRLEAENRTIASLNLKPRLQEIKQWDAESKDLHQLRASISELREVGRKVDTVAAAIQQEETTQQQLKANATA